MPTLLITGANRGLGLEFVRQYTADKWDVIACCRTPQAAGDLKAIPGVRVEELDVANDESILTLATKLHTTSIDLLINNAGIYSGVHATLGDDRSQNFGSINSDAWLKVLRVNLISPIKVIEAFAPFLQKGTGKKIVNITSRMGSIALAGSGSIAYRSSKAALNAAMRVILNDLKNRGLSVYNFHPGWVKTDMGGEQADLTPHQSITAMRDIIKTLKPEQSGQFLSYDGQVLPW